MKFMNKKLSIKAIFGSMIITVITFNGCVKKEPKHNYAVCTNILPVSLRTAKTLSKKDKLIKPSLLKKDKR